MIYLSILFYFLFLNQPFHPYHLKCASTLSIPHTRCINKSILTSYRVHQLHPFSHMLHKVFHPYLIQSAVHQLTTPPTPHTGCLISIPIPHTGCINQSLQYRVYQSLHPYHNSYRILQPKHPLILANCNYAHSQCTHITKPMGLLGCVGDHILQDVSSVWDQIQSLQNFVATPRQKLKRGGGGRRK
jgi:hypothetical protein